MRRWKNVNELSVVAFQGLFVLFCWAEKVYIKKWTSVINPLTVNCFIYNEIALLILTFFFFFFFLPMMHFHFKFFEGKTNCVCSLVGQKLEKRLT